MARLGGTRGAGLLLAGMLAAGLATVSGTALAASGSSSAVATMASRDMPAAGHAQTGFTNAWYGVHSQWVMSRDLDPVEAAPRS